MKAGLTGPEAIERDTKSPRKLTAGGAMLHRLLVFYRVSGNLEHHVLTALSGTDAEQYLLGIA